MRRIPVLFCIGHKGWKMSFVHTKPLRFGGYLFLQHSLAYPDQYIKSRLLLLNVQLKNKEVAKWNWLEKWIKHSWPVFLAKPIQCACAGHSARYFLKHCLTEPKISNEETETSEDEPLIQCPTAGCPHQSSPLLHCFLCYTTVPCGRGEICPHPVRCWGGHPGRKQLTDESSASQELHLLLPWFQ